LWTRKEKRLLGKESKSKWINLPSQPLTSILQMPKNLAVVETLVRNGGRKRRKTI